MRRTTGTLILLATLGGCSSVKEGPELAGKSAPDSKAAAPTAPSRTLTRKDDGSMKNGQSLGRASDPPLTSAIAATTTPKSGLSVMASTGGPLPIVPLTPSNAPAKTETTSQKVAVTTNGGSNLLAEPQSVPPAVAEAPRPLVINNVTPAAPPMLPPVLSAAGSSKPSLPPASSGAKPASLPATNNHDALPTPPTVTPASALSDVKAIRASSPAVRMVNSKRITLNYELKDVGPSGVSGVELWYTMDAKAWKKADAPAQSKPPYVIEVNDEGVYGFTLLARNGVGIAKDPPQSGEQPQVWVEVDTTRPIVRLIGIEANMQNKSLNLIVRWSATDKNLGPRPITLSYAERDQGPWTPMVSNIENSGRYVWQMPANVPNQFFIRAEAADLTGNIGVAQTPKSILVDLSKPTVSILNVEPAGK